MRSMHVELRLQPQCCQASSKFPVRKREKGLWLPFSPSFGTLPPLLVGEFHLLRAPFVGSTLPLTPIPYRLLELETGVRASPALITK